MPESIPEVAVTIAGFAGLLVALRRNAPFSPIEEVAFYFLLLASLGAALLGLLPAVVLAFVEPDTASAILCVASGLFLLGLSSWRAKRIHDLRPYARRVWLRRALGLVQWCLGGALILAGAGVLPRHALFVASLWWLVFVAIVQFFIQAVAFFAGSHPAFSPGRG